MTPGWRFQVLGPVRAWADGRELPAGSGRERMLLALLLLNADRVTPVERVVDALWSAPPRSARGQIHNMMCNWRRRLGPGADQLVRTRPAGYELRLGDHRLDLVDFRGAVDAARLAAPAEAADLLSAAVGFWHGPALADVPADAAAALREALDAELLAAREALLEARLALGRCDEVLRELPDLIAAQPYRESLYAVQLRALAATSRRAEALAAYRRAHHRLAMDLGIDPGPELRDLHRRVLRGIPVISPPSRPRTPSPPPASSVASVASPVSREPAAPPLVSALSFPSVPPPSPSPTPSAAPTATAPHPPPGTAPWPLTTASSPPAAVPAFLATTSPATARSADRPGPPAPSLPLPAAARLPPRQLPPLVGPVAGREKLIAEVQARLVDPSAAPVGVLAGPGGIGKTTVALAAAHGLAGAFPDGQLHADLRGSHRRPADPHAVLDRLLRALGVDRAPRDPDERVALYRSHLAGRRVLVVLDDVADERQVRPLLPPPGCAALLCSRRTLAGLVGVTRWSVPVLAADAAAYLISAVVGPERLVGEQAAVAAVAELCGRLPLAVAVAA
ncbi:MAG TPA: BTAD domain-containing putative transcriptional regulator, partial [Pseudonocardiaceae bacterium]